MNILPRHDKRDQRSNTARDVWKPATQVIAMGAVVLGFFCGCTPTFYRLQADREVYSAVRQKAHDPRWPLLDYTIRIDPASRMYDPNNPDFEPMPPDDPASHKLMHCVDGMCGDGCWHCDGDTPFVENPDWREFLPFNEQGQVAVDVTDAVELGLLHSRDYQRALENLYLSALDVTFERFRFDVQFFGGNDTFFTADGPIRSGAGESNSVLNTDTSFEARKLFATGGELVAGLANSLVWQFSGEDSNFATTLLDFSLVQPLLRGGGRARVLERLTLSERTLLANVRQMERYRQGFYVNLVTGRDAGAAPQRRGGIFGGAGLSGFTGVGGGGFGAVGNVTQGQVGAGGGGQAGNAGAADAGGYLGLLQDQQQIRNQEATVAALADSLAQLQAAFDAGRIDRFQVDQARQALYNTRSQLMINRASYQAALDRFKITLGLPPSLDLAITDPLLSPFSLIDPVIPPLQNRLTRLQETVGKQIVGLRGVELDPAKPDTAELRQGLANIRVALESAYEIHRQAAAHFAPVRLDIAELQANLPTRKKELDRLRVRGFADSPQGKRNPAAAGIEPTADDTPGDPSGAIDEIDAAIAGLEQLPGRLESDLRTLAGVYRNMPGKLKRLEEELLALAELPADDGEVFRSRLDSVLSRIPDQLVELSGNILELSLIQARARAETVSLLPIEMNPDSALGIASKNRLDWMNARASLVDSWRLIAFNANDLESNLDLVFSGDVRNVGDNPFNLNSSTGRLRVGFQFDAPLNRVAERNNYRQVLIEFQQARRGYYAFIDGVSQSLRSNLRQIDLDQANFELRRAAVRVAIDQVEVTRLRLRQPPRPGETTAFSPTTARDLVSALSDLQTVQNDFLSVWVNYEVERLSLDFGMGTMRLDERGVWIDPGSAVGANGLAGLGEGSGSDACGPTGEGHAEGPPKRPGQPEGAPEVLPQAEAEALPAPADPMKRDRSGASPRGEGLRRASYEPAPVGPDGTS